MLYRIVLLILIVAVTTQGAIPSTVIAKVNGFSLTEEEARLILDKKSSLSAKDIEKVVLFQLAVEKALAEKVDRDPSTATSIKKVLYKAYLRTVSKKNADRLQISRKDLESYYSENPLLRVFQIVLNGEPDTNTAKIQKIQAEHRKGVPFRKLVFTYSEDQTALHGGDLDYRSIHNFPEPLFNSLKSLPKNTLSAPHSENGKTLLFVWTEKKVFGESPETFKTFLTSKLTEQRELAVLRESLGDLREKAVVELLGGEKQ